MDTKNVDVPVLENEETWAQRVTDESEARRRLVEASKECLTPDCDA
jgi:hypothetical protein